MRIISNFKDYYDGLQHYNQWSGPDNVESRHADQRPWIRKEQEVYEEIKSRLEDHIVYGRVSGKLIPFSFQDSGISNATSYVIGFCGKFYPVIVIDDGVLSKRKNIHFFYNIEALDKFVEKENPKGNLYRNGDYKDYYTGKKTSQSIRLVERNMNDRERMVKFFNQGDKADSLDFIFEEYKTPSMVIKPNGQWRWNERKYFVTVNPQLSNYGFAKVFDPNQAYQQIEMFLGNMAHPEPVINPVPDDIKAFSRGHGSKYSFRTPPKKKG